jgi:hypothetical protein
MAQGKKSGKRKATLSADLDIKALAADLPKQPRLESQDEKEERVDDGDDEPGERSTPKSSSSGPKSQAKKKIRHLPHHHKLLSE